MEARYFRLVASTLALTAATQAASAVGQEFRIETDVYVGDSQEPSSHAVTLFEKSAVYEFVENPDQVIVYRTPSDDQPGQFILLDPATERRTEIDVERVERLMEKLTSWAAEQEDAVLKFSAKPQFTESFDAATGSLALVNSQWTYRVATVAANDPAALERYRKYTDRYALLSAMLNNSPPPGPRLALNAALATHEVVPVEIRRTIGGDEKNVVRAAHIFLWRLSRADRLRLDEAQKQLSSYKKVENEEFIAARAKQDAVRGQSK
jgi:hypothetical protein